MAAKAVRGTCLSCCYWVESSLDRGEGKCHFNAPVSAPLFLSMATDFLRTLAYYAEKAATGEDPDPDEYLPVSGVDLGAMWPGTNSEDWCGQYAQKSH